MPCFISVCFRISIISSVVDQASPYQEKPLRKRTHTSMSPKVVLITGTGPPMEAAPRHACAHPDGLQRRS